MSIRRGRDRLVAMSRVNRMVNRTFFGWMIVVCIACGGSVAGRAQAGLTGGTEMAGPPATPSTSLTLTIDGKHTSFSTAELDAMAQKTVKVHNEHTKADETYSGVLLGDVLPKFVAVRNPGAVLLRTTRILHPVRVILDPITLLAERASD